MRVLIAGSSGFIGSALTTELRGAGHEVRTLVRRQPGNVGGDTEYAWDPPRGALSSEALDGVDAVVNLCGAPLTGRWSEARKQQLRDSRIVPTEVLAEAVAEHGVPSLINASAVGYYGDTGDTLVDESAGAGSGFLAELCADWEQATRQAQRAGARVVRLRTGIVLGSDGGLLRVLKPLFSLALGGRLGAGEQYMPWISLTDQIAAIRYAVEHAEVSGPANLSAPNPVTNAEFTRALGRAVHRPAPWVVPSFALRMALSEAADEMALVSQRAVPAALRSAGFSFTHTELDAALVDELAGSRG
ncbi:TIGR01777 family oxidoreductase [Haloechinothrix sp. LS1_15]|uniref:TIGR01777 family oxidoreductase n=1 Tax=Haloechinothrix sp. LS1_15 TaxID=2652248 RepID=UPI00294712E8|nr:TIGR01777 family oxidoreductase [Haloechinothrix sp. LS1_15]MDV6012730.1 TIGR01777 family protein [Haloechinothrix sp. LS1_15]